MILQEYFLSHTMAAFSCDRVFVRQPRFLVSVLLPFKYVRKRSLEVDFSTPFNRLAYVKK